MFIPRFPPPATTRARAHLGGAEEARAARSRWGGRHPRAQAGTAPPALACPKGRPRFPTLLSGHIGAGRRRHPSSFGSALTPMVRSRALKMRLCRCRSCCRLRSTAAASCRSRSGPRRLMVPRDQPAAGAAPATCPDRSYRSWSTTHRVAMGAGAPPLSRLPLPLRTLAPPPNVVRQRGCKHKAEGR